MVVHKKEPFYKVLYIQVIIAIILGILLGHFYPSAGATCQFLGDAFIRIVKMIIAPVIFLTIVTGIASMNNMNKVGSVVGKAMVYFITFSTLALIIGLIVGNVIQPGAGFKKPVDVGSHAAEVSKYVAKAHDSSISGFLMNIIPDTVVSPLVNGNILQVIFVSVVFGIALSAIGKQGEPIVTFLQNISKPVFKMVGILMKLAPIGAFGAMAYTISKYGIGSIGNLFMLVVTFYITSALFIAIILGVVARYNGFSIFKLIKYIKSELLLVLGTSSSEAALPTLMDKMEKAGCDRSVTGLVIPMGYSFNLDGTNIYMTLASLFIAQAYGVHLTLTQQISLLLVAMISSKGAAGVTGAGFITLAATISIVPTIPIEGMGLILGIDRFMSECRALTNLVGNACANIVVAKWENGLDKTQLQLALSGQLEEEIPDYHLALPEEPILVADIK